MFFKRNHYLRGGLKDKMLLFGHDNSSDLSTFLFRESFSNNYKMAEHLEISNGGKEEKYDLLFRQIKSLVEAEPDPIAVMANSAAMIHETFGFLWTGFYRVIEGMLVLGPFQGPLACTRIPFGKGVCGTAWKEGKTLVVPDVEKFPGHIACSSSSRSEIVVPVKKDDKIIAVLDIDSEKLATFDDTDRLWLQRIARIIFNQ